MFEVKEGTWIFGELEGHFELRNGHLSITKGIIRSAQYVEEKPLSLSSDFHQKSISGAWVQFKEHVNADFTVNDRQLVSNVDELNIVNTIELDLSDTSLRNHTLDPIKVEGDDSYGHIRGLFWGRVNKQGSGSHPFLWLLSIVALIGVFLLSPVQNQSIRQRIVSPTLPQQSDSLVDKETSTSDSPKNNILENEVSKSPEQTAESDLDPQSSSEMGSDTAGDMSGLGNCSDRLVIDSDLLFDSGQSRLKNNSAIELKAMKPLIHALNEQNLLLRVIGHTDSVGGDEYNQQLSLRRAERIANWLVRNSGVPRHRIRIEGKGETELLTTDPEQQHLNRRVEIGFVCSEDGVLILFNDSLTLEGPETPKNDESPENTDFPDVSLYIPEGIKIKDIVEKPEIFLDSCGVPLLLSSDLLFDFDRATLQGDAINELSQLAQVFRDSQDKQLKLKIIGHTDAVGSIQHNQRLSKRRAERVARWLIEHKAVKKEQLLIEGWGERSLIVPIDAPEEAQKYNRRVEIIVICSSKNSIKSSNKLTE